MNKVSVVLYYWILVAATLLFARTFGMAQNDEAIIKILIVVTIIYVGVIMTVFSKWKKLDAARETAEPEGKNGSSKGSKKKKK